MRLTFNAKLDPNVTYWITSDLHFGHKNILNFCPETRPQASVEEMDEYLINHWNSLVKENDVIFHLGDFSFYGAEKTKSIIDRLNGKVVWIRGNHDKSLDSVLQRSGDHMHEYVECRLDGTKLCLMHFPLAEWNQKHRGAIMLHGHQHGSGPGYPGRIADVGYDACGSILRLRSVVAYIKAGDPYKGEESRDRG
ncbi:phosphoesterase [Vibrio phage vB_ValS_X1]|uniref:Phosphoesterase n=1 Tax=Vibrio phage vB_ValS_X1 TaxID=2736341 RepID=A0A6M9Z6A7_9CAUD|nr:phosphoesterase [Vibrio phage vB_ValS_X1]